MLTSYPDEEAVIAAIIAGASGYLLKQVRARDLVAALEAVGRGESLLDPAVTGKVLERMRRIASADQPDELGALTQQERKILALVAEGKTNKEIAAEVFLSDKTVKNYVELDPREAQPRAPSPGGRLCGADQESTGRLTQRSVSRPRGRAPRPPSSRSSRSPSPNRRCRPMIGSRRTAPRPS